MSRSILKVPDPQRRVVAIPANEGHGESLGMAPWEPLDQGPFMEGFQQEMNKIQKDLNKMQRNMMSPFPNQGQLFEPLQPPPLQVLPPPPMSMPPLMPLQAQTGTTVSPGGFNVNTAMVPALPEMDIMDGTIFAQNGLSPGGMFPAMPMPAPGPTPVIYDTKHGYKAMELELDVKGFQPEDIQINTEGKVLQVHARRLSVKQCVKKDGLTDSKSTREYRRQFTLPDIVRAENLHCFVNANGTLTIEGALGHNIVRQKTNKKKVKFAAPKNYK